MVYIYVKDLTRRTESDKILHYKPFDVARNPNYDWIPT